MPMLEVPCHSAVPEVCVRAHLGVKPYFYCSTLKQHDSINIEATGLQIDSVDS